MYKFIAETSTKACANTTQPKAELTVAKGSSRGEPRWSPWGLEGGLTVVEDGAATSTGAEATAAQHSLMRCNDSLVSFPCGLRARRSR